MVKTKQHQLLEEENLRLRRGPMMMGTIGEDDRMDTTVIGDAVNLASRIESLTKVYGVLLLITEHTFRNLKHPEKYSIRQIDTVKVRGKDEPVTIYEILDVLSPEIKQKKLNIAGSFSKALGLIHEKDFVRAMPGRQSDAGTSGTLQRNDQIIITTIKKGFRVNDWNDYLAL